MPFFCTNSFDEAVQAIFLGKPVVILQQSNLQSLFRLYKIFLCHYTGILFVGRRNIPLDAYGYIMYCSETQPMPLLIGWTYQCNPPKREFWQYQLKLGDIILLQNNPFIFHNAFRLIPEGLALQSPRSLRS